MTYSYQTFSSGQILTAAQAQQCEVNIRDHVHGISGSVQNVGLNWPISSINAARAMTAADIGGMYQVYGDINLDFLPVNQLGSLFSVSFLNASSGRVVLRASGGELIGASSQFVLTPRASINVFAGSSGHLSLFGDTVGWFTLYDAKFPTSVKNVTLDHIFPGDFDVYEVSLTDPLVTSNAGSIAGMLVSTDSGSSFEQLVYDNAATFAQSYCISLTTIAVVSNQLLSAIATFTNPTNSLAQFYGQVEIKERSGGGMAPDPITVGTFGSSVAGIVNALQIQAVLNTGYFEAGRCTLRAYRGTA